MERLLRSPREGEHRSAACIVLGSILGLAGIHFAIDYAPRNLGLAYFLYGVPLLGTVACAIGCKLGWMISGKVAPPVQTTMFRSYQVMIFVGSIAIIILAINWSIRMPFALLATKLYIGSAIGSVIFVLMELEPVSRRLPSFLPTRRRR